MNMDTTRMHEPAAYPPLVKAHVPQLPDHDINPNIPPSIPPDAPDEVDLPAREDSPDIDEPDKPPHERVLFWPGHRVVLKGHP